MMAGALNKKPPALAGFLEYYYLDQLSKAALIDLAVEMMRRQHGADETEGVIVDLLEKEYLPPVLRLRKDKMPNMANAISHAKRREQQRTA